MQQLRKLNDQYSIFDESLLGKGSTGDVYLGCVNGNPAHKVAIKSINLHDINNEVTKYLLSCEIAALSNLGKLQNTQHENIVRLLQIIILQNNIYLVMELLEGGTLANYISRHPNGLPEEEALMIFRQILEGYKRVKDKQVVHRDLKPDNILFKADPNRSKKIAIIDFGYCEMREVPNKPQLFYNVGSPKYMSPQAYKQNKYSQKSDIWAIGVILYQMLLGKTCDNGMTMQTYLEMIQTKGIPLPGKLKNLHKHLLSQMLHCNHQARISCDQVLRILSLQPISGTIHQPTLANRLGNEYLRSTIQSNPSQRPNRNNPVFHSTLLTSQMAPNTFKNNQNPMQTFHLPRSSSHISDQKETNIRQVRGLIRDSEVSLHNEQKVPKRVFIRQNPTRAENVELNSVRQILNRRQIVNNMIPKAVNTQLFSKQDLPFFSQNSGQQTIHIQRPAMNQIVNQINGKINMPPQARSSHIIATPKQNITFAKDIHQSSQHRQLFFNGNETPKNHAKYFQISRNKQSQIPQVHVQHTKKAREKVKFLEIHSFTEPNQYRQQTDQIIQHYFPQNKVRALPISQAQVSYDLMQTRNPHPDLTRNLESLPNPNSNRSQLNETNKIEAQLIDLTQTRPPIHVINSCLLISNTPRASQEIELNKANTPHHSITLQGFSQKIDISEKAAINKVPSKPFQMAREIVSLKPQVFASRSVGNKINYVRLHPPAITQSHLMPSAVK